MEELNNGFREWIDEQEEPSWNLLPLTYITKCYNGEAIIKRGSFKAIRCEILETTRAFFFYGRPNVRASEDGPIEKEALCPMCFILDGTLIKAADEIFAFDLGAYNKRLYKNYILDEMDLREFSLEKDIGRVHRLIAKSFTTQERYFENDFPRVDLDNLTERWQFLPRSFLSLIKATGRNEPDDKISTLEISFDRDVEVGNNLRAVIVPHTIYTPKKQAPWLSKLDHEGKLILPYSFIPGESRDFYQGLIEAEVRELYRKWALI